jgi:hypothetical protein
MRGRGCVGFDTSLAGRASIPTHSPVFRVRKFLESVNPNDYALLKAGGLLARRLLRTDQPVRARLQGGRQFKMSGRTSMKKFVLAAATAASLAMSGAAFAADECGDGEIVIKFSHVVSAPATRKVKCRDHAGRTRQQGDGRQGLHAGVPELAALRRRQGDGSPAARRRSARRAVALQVRGLHPQVPCVRPAVPVLRTWTRSIRFTKGEKARSCSAP